MPAGGAPADGTAPANPVQDSNSLLPRRFVALTALMCLITTMGVVFNGGKYGAFGRRCFRKG